MRRTKSNGTLGPLSWIFIVIVIVLEFVYDTDRVLSVLTFIVTSVSISYGLAKARGNDYLEQNRHVRFAQQLGGSASAAAASVGSYYVGWRYGWAGALAGYLLGQCVTGLFALITGLV